MWELAWLKISTEPASKPALKIKRVKIRGKHNQTNRKSAVRTFQRTNTNPKPLILRAIKSKGHLRLQMWTYKNNFELKVCNFIKKETPAQMLSYDFWEISKNALLYRIPLVAASVRLRLNHPEPTIEIR